MIHHVEGRDRKGFLMGCYGGGEQDRDGCGNRESNIPVLWQYLDGSRSVLNTGDQILCSCGMNERKGKKPPLLTLGTKSMVST